MSYYLKSDIYEKLNHKLTLDHGNGKCQLRVFQNLWVAIYDVTSSLLIHTTHKNQIGLVKNGFSLSEQLSKIWLKQTLPVQNKSFQQSWPEYIASLKEGTNFVIWASENEVTGEIIVDSKTCREIHEQLAAKRIVSIQVTHRLSQDVPTTPYSVFILRENIFKDGLALAFLSEKFRADSILGAHQVFPNIKSVEQMIQDSQKLVYSKELHGHYSYFGGFSSFSGYLQDRAVLYFPDLNASAVKVNLNLSDSLCFCSSELPFWVLDLFKNWWLEAEKEQLLRGLMVVSIDAINKDTDFFNKISNSVDEIRRLGNWTVL